MLVERLFDGHAFNILEKREILFRCGCNREKSREALHILGEDELKDILLKKWRGRSKMRILQENICLCIR